MNNLKKLWNIFLEKKAYIDLAFLVFAIFFVFVLLHFTIFKFATYVYGCWCLGGKLGQLSYWLSNKLK